MRNDSIPWSEIDPEMRPLIGLLNDRSGIQTEWCCYGHEPASHGYVSFVVDSIDDIHKLLLALPPMSCSIDANVVGPEFARFRNWKCEVDANCPDTRHLRFHLRFFGYPDLQKALLLGEFENALRSAAQSK